VSPSWFHVSIFSHRHVIRNRHVERESELSKTQINAIAIPRHSDYRKRKGEKQPNRRCSQFVQPSETAYDTIHDRVCSYTSMKTKTTYMWVSFSRSTASSISRREARMWLATVRWHSAIFLASEGDKLLRKCCVRASLLCSQRVLAQENIVSG
jgi:hypothetical protein